MSGSKSSAFWAGVRAESPILLGVFPFGMIYGALARDAGLSAAASQAMSSIVFGGASQFIAAKLIKESAPALVIVLTIAVVNLRHLLYSASVAEYVRALPLRWKLALAYLLTDEAYAAAIVHYETEGAGKDGHWFFLGAGLALWTCWQVSTALGVFAGAAIPPTWRLDFALPLTFLAMVVPTLKDRASAAAALVGGVAALAFFAFPYKLGILAAALAGIAAGLLLEKKA